MAKKKYDESEGVWRTIGGRRVFIREGQSLADAMRESGKFKSAKKKEKLTNSDEDKEIKGRMEELQREIDSGRNSKEKTERLKEELQQYKDNYEEEKTIPKEKTIHTQSGDYTEKELKDRDEKVKQMYKDSWNNKMSAKDLHDKLEEMKNNGEISQGELSALQYDASREIEKGYWENAKEAYDIRQREGLDKFIQKTDMYGGEVEYTNEDLKRMEETGTRPMAHSYTGGGWEGTKYDSKLSTKEIAKNITDYSKKEFPDVKLSRKTDYNGIDIHIMNSEKDLYRTQKDIDNMSDDSVFNTIRDSIGGVTKLDDWLNENNRKSPSGTYTANDARDYLKERLNQYRNRKGDNVSGNEWYLSDYGKKVVSGLNKEMNSYNYDDSDGMVDYFDTNFYGYVHIGKWDKPYEVTDTKIKTPKSSSNDTFSQRYSGSIDYLKQTTNLSGNQILELLKKMEQDRNK